MTLFIVLFLIVLLIEFVGFRAYRAYKTRQKEFFTQENLGLSAKDLHSALIEKRQRIIFCVACKDIAQKEGYQFEARVWDALVQTERIHEKILCSFLERESFAPSKDQTTTIEKWSTTQKNFENIAVRKKKFSEVLAEKYKKQARQHKRKDIAKVFDRLGKVDAEQAFLCGQFAERFDKESDSDFLTRASERNSCNNSTNISLCVECGKIEIGQHSAFCIICNTPCFQFVKL